MAKRTSIVFVLSFCSGFLLAQDLNTVDDARQELERYSEVAGRYKSVTARFEQVVEVPYMVEPLESSGSFYSRGSDAYRWEQDSPEKFVMIITDERAYIYEAGKWQTRDIQRNRQYGFISKMLDALVSGNVLEEKTFEVAVRSNVDHIEVELIPDKDRMKNYIRRITCLARKSDYLLESIAIEDGEGTITTITFSDQKADIALPDNLFKPESD